MKISVIVTLKKDVLDPQGKVVNQALKGMGFNTVKEINAPILLHVYTNKSKRIKHFESDDAVKYYSLSPLKKNNNNSLEFFLYPCNFRP